MKNKRYISCTDKRVVITLIISIIVFVVTILLLSKGGYAPGILKENVITSKVYWYFITFLFYTSLLSFIVMSTVFVFGLIIKCSNNRKQAKSLDSFKVVFRTEIKLSKDQKNEIFTIIKDGVTAGLQLNDIAIKIMMSLNYCDFIILQKNKNIIEVIM